MEDALQGSLDSQAAFHLVSLLAATAVFQVPVVLTHLSALELEAPEAPQAAVRAPLDAQ